MKARIQLKGCRVKHIRLLIELRMDVDTCFGRVAGGESAMRQQTPAGVTSLGRWKNRGAVLQERIRRGAVIDLD
jgi:hypothetical protein